ncbi:MAG: GreA/GreB family elongation factor, partial [Anaerolineae bacterium]|nr:GreA/GreB family elongation factor [Anaerolineae bacterium]
SFLEGRIYNLEQQLRYATLINEEERQNDVVTLGSSIVVQEDGSPEPENYKLVGSAEASPMQGKISNESPLGKVLLGKRVGEQAIVQAPDGDIVFTILEIH